MRKFLRRFVKIKKLWPIIFILFLSVLFFYPVILQSKLPLPLDALVGAHVPWIEVSWKEYPAGVPIKNQEITDAISQFYPWKSLIGNFWRAGKIPLWNQYMFSGYPLLANLHSGGLYPLNFFYLFLSDANSWTIIIYMQIFLALLFMFLFLRDLGLDKKASVFGAIIFSFSGYMIAWLEFANGGQAGLWLPLLLFFELKLVKSRDNIYIFPASVIFYFIYTAGDFQVPFYETIVFILFGGYLLFSQKNIIENGLIFSLKIISALVIGILLSLPQLIPTAELFLNSVRTSDPYIREYYYGIMNWEKIVNFIWPDFFGNIVTRNYWGNFGFHEYLAFTGVVSIIFLIYGLLTKKRSLEIFFWFILFLSLLFLFPTPLAFLPYKLNIPALGSSSASRILYLVDFCIATLSAYGFYKWYINKDNRIVRIIFYLLVITSGVTIGLLLNIYFLKQYDSPDILRVITNLRVSIKNIIPSTLILMSVFLIIVSYKYKPLKKINMFKYFNLSFFIIIFCSAEMLRFAWKNTPFFSKDYLFPTTKTLEYLMKQQKPFRISGSGIPLNYFMQYGLSSAEGYDPIYPWRNSRWYSLINFLNTNNPGGRYGEIAYYNSPLIDYANIKYVIDYKKNPLNKELSDKGVFADGLQNDRFSKVFTEKRVYVFQNEDFFPRIWLGRDYLIASNENELISLITNLKNKEQKIIFENKPDILLVQKKIDYSVENYKQALNEISFDVENKDDAYLFLSETYFPGWQAFIDGHKTKIYKSNYIYQSIFVPKGRHNIYFVYSPISFKIGKYISIITASLIILVLIKEKLFRAIKNF